MENTISEFHLAVTKNDVNKVQELLNDGINPDEPDWNNNGRPAILEATYHGYVNIVKLLLHANANSNAQNSLGETALHNAFYPKSFSKELVLLLLEHGSDVNIREKLNGYTVIHVAAKLCSSRINKTVRRDILHVLKIVCEKADTQIRSARKESPMHRLVSGSVDCVEALQVLVESGFELNVQNDRGETSLMCAIDKGHGDMAEFLVKKGACVNIKDMHFQTALHHSAQKNLLRIMRVLLDVQCDVNAIDLNGDTALHIASSKGLSDMVHVLLSHPGIDVNIQNIRGSTPLLNVVESGFTKVVQLLLDAYCDAECEKGLLNALDMAEDEFVRRWHPEIFSLLHEALEIKRDLWDEGETSL